MLANFQLILQRKVICPTSQHNRHPTKRNEQDTNEPDFQLHIIDVLAGPIWDFWNKLKQIYKEIIGGGFKDFVFSPLPGEMIQFD